MYLGDFCDNEIKNEGNLILFGKFPSNQQKGDFVNEKDIIFILEAYWPYLLMGLVFAIPFVQSFYRKHKENILVILVLFVMFWISIISLANSAGNPFMYLRF